MSKGMYHKIREAWKSPDMNLLRSRMIDWRKSETITRVDKPLRLDRARNLGYKVKDFTAGNLPVISYVRPDKLFTADTTIIKKVVGILTPKAKTKILQSVHKLFPLS